MSENRRFWTDFDRTIAAENRGCSDLKTTLNRHRSPIKVV